MTDLAIWECLYRIGTLNKFISYLKIYQDHSEYSGRRGRGRSFASDETGLETRKKINLMIPKVARYLLQSGNYPVVNYRDPPAIGGRMISNIQILQNIFDLSEYGIPMQIVIDWVQKGVGYYQDDLLSSFLRTINPFWWLLKLTKAIVRTPFRIMDLAGLDSGKVEHSSGGQLYKGIANLVVFTAGLVTFLASVVQILDSFDLIQPVKDFLQRLFQ